ncbi:MAG: hypothetical protein H7211_05785 [Aquabacterium sp.]|nr:hypothetical protein [Ferruginibacter sp.]
MPCALYFFCTFIKRKDYGALNVSISDIEYNKFGLKDEKLTFTDFIEIVSKELADKYGLSKMTIDGITNEVKAVRKNAENRS